MNTVQSTPVNTTITANHTNQTDLQSIAVSLQQIAASLQRAPSQPTGFTNTKTTTVVYANLTKGNGDGWYTLKDDKTTTMLPEFYGIVTSFEFPTTTRRNQEVKKFHLMMQDLDGHHYIFESGIDTFFTRSILYAIALANSDELAAQFRLFSYIPTLDTGDRTLGVSVTATATGRKLSSGWKSSDDWRSITVQAREKLAGVSF